MMSSLSSLNPQHISRSHLKASQSSSQREGTLILDPKVIAEILKYINQIHVKREALSPFDRTFSHKLRVESKDVCEFVAKDLGINTDNAYVRCFRIDGFHSSVQDVVKEVSNRYRPKGNCEKAQANLISIITHKGENTPIAAHIGAYTQEYRAYGQPSELNDKYWGTVYGKDFAMSEQGAPWLSPQMAPVFKTEEAYEPIKHLTQKHSKVVSGPYAQHQTSGSGNIETIRYFMQNSPQIFKNSKYVDHFYKQIE